MTRATAIRELRGTALPDSYDKLVLAWNRCSNDAKLKCVKFRLGWVRPPDETSGLQRMFPPTDSTGGTDVPSRAEGRDVWRSGGPSNAANPMLPVSIDLLCKLYGDAPRNVCCAFSGQSPHRVYQEMPHGALAHTMLRRPSTICTGWSTSGIRWRWRRKCTDRCSPTNIWMIWDIVGRLPPKLASLTATLSVLGTTDGLKGCAARTGKPASALDPAAALSQGQWCCFAQAPSKVGHFYRGEIVAPLSGTDTVCVE